MPASNARGTPPVVTTVCLQPGGTLLAAAGDDHHIYLWDVRLQRVAGCLIGHTDWVHAVKFSADGQLLASAGHDGQVILWDPSTVKQIGVLDRGGPAITELAWSTDGKRLAASGFAAEIRVYDVEGRNLLEQLPGPSGDLPHLGVLAQGRSSGGRRPQGRGADLEVRRHAGDRGLHGTPGPSPRADLFG